MRPQHAHSHFSPSNQKLSDNFKLALGQPFCKYIGLLLVRADVSSNNPLRLPQMGSKEVVLQTQIFFPGGHLGHIDHAQATLIVFKNVGADKAVRDEG